MTEIATNETFVQFPNIAIFTVTRTEGLFWTSSGFIFAEPKKLGFLTQLFTVVVIGTKPV